MFKNCFLCFVIIFTIFHCVDNYRILGVFPMSARSHFFLGSTLMKGLAERGHDVTIVAPFKDEEPPSLSKNGSYRQIVLTGIEELQKKITKNGKLDIQRIRNNMKSAITSLNMIGTTIDELTEDIMKDSELQMLMKSGEKFDVVIVSEFLTKVIRGFAHHFEASLILFANSGVINWYNDEVGKIILPSIGPVTTTTPYRMNFLQRLHNTIEKIQSVKWFQDYTVRQNKLLKKYLPNSPSIEEISRNISLVLINSDPSTEVPQPLLPNIINIGGFHVKPPKNLPEDLQQIMDNAKHGVIYFSFGTIMDPRIISSDKLQEILRVFEKRKETILWKFSGELPQKPKNIITRKWLPQQDILAHPNVKLFITHSGYLSTIETTYHGVPTVSVPFAADQMANARFVEETGSGIVIQLENVGGVTMEKAIEEVISNSKYSEAAKRKSRILRDRPNRAIDDAIFWVEYVVRHKGAKHLRVTYLDMPLYQIYMLDILGVILAGVVVSVLLLLFIVIKLCNCIRKRRRSDKVSDQIFEKKNH